MTDAETHAAKLIFGQALNYPPDQRADFLVQACGGDETLRRRVEALLAAHEEADRFMADPTGGGVFKAGSFEVDTAGDIPGEAAVLGAGLGDGASRSPRSDGETRESASISERPGTRIGPYKLLEHIGEGGFGSVFMADQEKPVRRRVAFKIIKLGMDTKQVIARFEAERQALAMMEHPNIARVLDAGATETGRPYFVMELVRGDPVTEYCDRERLSPDERLELFGQICHAVQHAHTKGIIHRDLKPTNVLVTIADGKPVPKVIDFGVAKATSGRLTDKTLFTEFRQLIGTPAYMSPEQADASALDIDTRSDIYSLGVLLYELLTGTAPFDAARLRGLAYDEMRRIIREEEPERPSMRISKLLAEPEAPARDQPEPRPSGTGPYEAERKPLPHGRGSAQGTSALYVSEHRRTDPASLTRLLRGDLDWIVMKCLEKDRTRRYETANALALDIQHHLDHEPVLAGPPGAAYRFRKFARRNRGALVAAAAIAASLVVGLALATVGFVRAESQRQRAEHNFEVAEEERERAEEQRRRAEENFEKARDAVDRMLTQAAEKLEDVPHMQLVRRALLEDAIEFYEGFLAERSDDPGVRSEAGRAHRRVGAINRLLGQDEQAEEAYTHAVDIFDKMVTEFPDQPEYRKELATTYTRLGYLLRDVGRAEECEVACRDALTVWKKLVDEFPDMPEYRSGLGCALGNLGLVLSDTGQREEAERVYQDGLAVFDKLEELNADFASEPEYRSELARIHHNLGVLLGNTGRKEEEKAEYRRAVELLEKLVAEFPEKRKYQDALALYLRDLGSVLRGTDQSLEAEEELYPRALEMREQLASDFPSVPVYWERLVDTQESLAQFFTDQKRLDEAEKVYRQALDIRQKRAAENRNKPQYQWQPTYILCSLLDVLATAGKIDEAQGEFEQAAQAQKELIAGYPEALEYCEQLAYLHFRFAYTLSNVARNKEAERSYRQSLAIFEDFEKLNASGTKARHAGLAASIHNNLGVLLKDTGRQEDAVAEYRRAIDVCEKLAVEFPAKPESRDYSVRYPLRNLGRLLLRTGQFEEAEKVYRRALGLEEELVSDDPKALEYREHLVYTHSWFADGLRDAGRMEEAEAAYRRAVSVADQTLVELTPQGDDYYQLHVWTYASLVRRLTDAGRPEEAEQLRGQGLALMQQLAAEHPEPHFRKFLAYEYREFAKWRESVGKSAQAEELRRKGLAVLEKLVADVPDDPKHRQELYQAYRESADSLVEAGRSDQAEAEWRKAIEVQQGLVAKFPKTSAHARELAWYCRAIARRMRDAGRPQKAEEFLHAAIDVQSKVAAEFPDEPKHRDLLCYSYRMLGDMLKQGERLDEAEAAYRQAIAVQEALLAEYPDSVDFIEELEEVYVLLSHLLWTTDRVEQADDSLAKARALWERLPDLTIQPQERETVQRAHVQLAGLLSTVGRNEEALRVLRQAADVQEALAAKSPRTSRYLKDLAHRCWVLGREMWEAGRTQQAEEFLLASIDVRARVAAKFPDEPKQRDLLCWFYRRLGEMLGKGGRLDEAEAAYRQAIAVQEALLAEYPDSADFIEELEEAYVLLSDLLRTTDRVEQADESLAKARALWERLPDLTSRPQDREIMHRAHVQLGKLLSSIGRQEEAIAVYRQGVAVQEALHASDLSADRHHLGLAYRFLGRELQWAGRMDEAEEAFRSAIDVYATAVADLPGDSFWRGELEICHRLLADLLSEAGRIEEAAEHFRQDLSGYLGRDLISLAKNSPDGVAQGIERARAAEIDQAQMEPAALLACGEFLLIGGDAERGAAAIQRATEKGGNDHWYYKSLGWALASAGRADEAKAAFTKTLGSFHTWSPVTPAGADIDRWTAAYFLDLVSQEQYTQRWHIDEKFACFPWFYVGQRAEINGRVADAIAAYEKAVELGELPNAHHMANFAAYRLRVLPREEPDGRD